MPRYHQLSLVALVALLSLAVGGVACNRKSSAKSENSKGVVVAMDKADAIKNPTTVDKTPIPGVDISKLSAAKTERFYAHVAALPSPCGKAHSLRTSLIEDKTCKRAPFAVEYLIQMLDDEVEDDGIVEFYDLRFTKKTAVHTFKLDESVPHHGPVNAPVQVVEFYDYGCPACKMFAPALEEATSRFPEQAVLFYKQFPLPSHTHSKGAAQAALAALRQGKFSEMHRMLFANQPNHEKSNLEKYASIIGLDMDKFAKDFDAVLPLVEADVQEGDEADLHGTPSIFINGRQYEGPAHPTYIQMAIEEALVVNP